MTENAANIDLDRHYAIPPCVRTAVPIVDRTEVFPVRRIYCVGRNYVAHIREMGGQEREPPFFFQKPTDSIVLSNNEIPYPPATASFQYEIELVIAIGKAGRNIPLADARKHMFGYAVGVDLTRRDLQLKARDTGRPWESGKSFDHSAPIGSLIPLGNSRLGQETPISLQVNGITKQHAKLGDMIWSGDEIVNRLSTLFSLEPGDLIFTGTPAGVGDLRPGDQVEGSVEGLGRVCFTIGSTIPG